MNTNKPNFKALFELVREVNPILILSSLETENSTIKDKAKLKVFPDQLNFNPKESKGNNSFP
ncbi:hypothetical protein D3C87_2198880 [compost metagenome]